ncbi:nitrous oxide reductase accessory protein NosL [Maribacter sp.]|uniref:nitrous oxide reductase accessory protein NosL n=1 Tax=Maribacter sp. TaxID=1897614 RepID=UPI0025C0CECE|nr:nitrous oxide reductase accessory protein NosL [Maribacter sp.]
MKAKFSFVILITVWLSACNSSPEPIEYGTDGCHFCKMTIVDRQHASEIVTKKGKAFKFDAIECMMNHVNTIDRNKVKLFLANDYNRPGELMDAATAVYLISKEVPSPMGEYLTAFKTKEEAEKVREEHGGKLYSWEELQNKFKK